MYHSALVVDVLVGKQEAVGPVVEYEEARVDGRRCRAYGYIIYIIYGLVDACVGIEVVAKLHADALAVFYHAVAGEVLCAVEAHVLKEVSQTALVLFFKNRAHTLCDVEVCLTLWLGVVAYVVRQTIVQLANANGLVYGNSWLLLCESICSEQCHCHYCDK